MVISTHLPPPVMMDRTEGLEAVTHILCCNLAMCFSAAPSSENDHGSMNLASKTAPVASTMPSRVAAIQRLTGWKTWRCTSLTTWPVLRSYQCRLRCSVTVPSWTIRLLVRSSGSISPRKWMRYSSQIRAGRALLGWSQAKLARIAGVGLATLQRIEQNEGVVKGNFSTVLKIQKALEQAGIHFADGEAGEIGVSLQIGNR